MEVYNNSPVYEYYDCNISNTTDSPVYPSYVSTSDIVVVVAHAFIFCSGVIGNGLVIYVVARFTQMKTVTNLYILNLAISDVVFFVSLPFTTVTVYKKYWAFGSALCKIYYVLYSISFFGGIFTLTALSIDRYLAVCHAVTSQRYRKPRLVNLIILAIWSVSVSVMLPTILYGKMVPNPDFPKYPTCTIDWPSGQLIPTDRAYIWYTFLLGFGMPITLIMLFYFLVVLKLKHIGPAKKSKETRKNHSKVTRMVLSVISVYVLCWLPYWGFQLSLTVNPIRHQNDWKIIMFSFLSILSYTNSMLNPILYAFLSENFRQSFIKAFKCVALSEFNSFQKTHRHSCGIVVRNNDKEETIELRSVEQIDSHDNKIKKTKIELKDNGSENSGLLDKTNGCTGYAEKEAFESKELVVLLNGRTEILTSCTDDSLQFVDKEIQTKTL